MIRPEFQVHILNIEGLTRAGQLAEAFSACLEAVEHYTGGLPCREMAIVRTKLEEASFFAKKAMAKNTEFQKTNGSD